MNNNIVILNTEILSDNWYTLKKVEFEFTRKNGKKEILSREAYDRGNGSAILIYNKETRKVVLTRQFRLPTFINGNADGMMIEACAGLLDTDNPEECIIRELEEETGYLVTDVEKVFQLYMSPGSVTEILYFFIASYTNQMQHSKGGGIEDEEIEVIEIDIDEAMNMMYAGIIKDAKTIILLQHLKLKKLL